MSQDWMDEDCFREWAESGLILCESVGFVTHTDENYIVITQTKFDGGFTENIKIPRKAIKEIRRLYNE